MALGDLFIIRNPICRDESASEKIKDELLAKFFEIYSGRAKSACNYEYTKEQNLVVVQTSIDSFEKYDILKAGDRSMIIKPIKDLTKVFLHFLNIDENSSLSNSKRTTLADLGDQLIAVQLSSKGLELNSEKFSIHNTTWKTYQNLMKKKSRGSLIPTSQSYFELSEEEMVAWQEYDKFCKQCNMKDIVDFCNESCTNGNGGLVDVALFDDKRKDFEMILVACLLENAKSISVVNIKQQHVDVVEATKEDVLLILDPLKGRHTIGQTPSRSQIPVNCSQSLSTTPISTQNNTIFYPETPKSCAKNQLKKIMLSYLRLLINSRDEIALARVINAPNRELHHRAFTDLRKTAHLKGLPMFQTAVSFILQTRLGGKGYAPDNGCLLKQHVKGLSEFVSLMHKLQGIVEDSANPREAFMQILRCLRLAFIKAKVPVFSSETVLDCVEELQKQLLDKLDRVATNKELPKSTIVELKVILALKALLEQEAIASFLDFENEDRIASSILSTPELNSALVKLPSLSSQFRTPEERQIETPKRPCSRKQRASDAMISKRSVIGDMRWALPVNTEAIRGNRKEPERKTVGNEVVDIDGPSNLQNSKISIYEEEMNGSGDVKHFQETRNSFLNKENTVQNEIKSIKQTKNDNKKDSIKVRKATRNSKIEKIKQKSTSNKAKIKYSKANICGGQKQLTSFFKKSM